ncbi:hypothetical protein RB213_012322 [Colletotrichum asianum]
MESAGSQPSSYSLLDDDDDEFKILPPMPGVRVAPHLKIVHLPPNNDAHTVADSDHPNPGCGGAIIVVITQLATWATMPLEGMLKDERHGSDIFSSRYGRRWAAHSGGRRPFDYLEDEDDDDYLLLSPSTYVLPEPEMTGFGKRIRKVFGF